MKTAGVFTLIVASTAAFTSPLLATRAVGGTAKITAPVKKAATAVKKAAPVKQVASAVKKAAPVKQAASAVKKAAPVKQAVSAVKKAAPAVKKAVPAKPVKQVASIFGRSAPAKPVNKAVSAVKKAVPAKPVKQAVSAVKKVAPAAKKAVPAPARRAATNAVSSFKSRAANAPRPPPESKGYPSFAAEVQNFRLGRISGGGNKSINPVFIHPTVNNAAAPSFDYKELGKQRLAKIKNDFVYDDGLTELERRQRATIPAFLTGGAKTFKNVDKTAITKDLQISDYPFGLNGDQFQLLFISIFGLFTLVGCLSGSIKLD